MSKKILVMVDMQNDFIHGALGNKECEAVVPKITTILNESDYEEVYVTFDTHDKHYLETQEGKKLPVEHCIAGTDGWIIEPVVFQTLRQNYSSEKVIGVEKNTFGSNKLGNMLAEKYSDGSDLTIDFVGVCTGICVISNAIIAKTFCPEAEINIISEACACVTPESHKTALEAMKLLQMNII